MKKDSLITALKKTTTAIGTMLPILISVMLLVSLVNAIVPKSAFSQLFQGNIILDPLLGSAIGSVLAGNPITGYVIGGELLEQGVSLLAVTALVVSWVTVGLIQLPAEIEYLGKKFALMRSVLSFLLSILVAIITYGVMILL